MRKLFDPLGGLILVSTTVQGPGFRQRLQCVLDTGTTTSGLSESTLARLGFDLQRPVGWTEVGTASEIYEAGIFKVSSIGAMGIKRKLFPVVSLRFPDEIEADGLLGLDFIRDHRLVVDMRQGFVEID